METANRKGEGGGGRREGPNLDKRGLEREHGAQYQDMQEARKPREALEYDLVAPEIFIATKFFDINYLFEFFQKVSRSILFSSF